MFTERPDASGVGSCSPEPCKRGACLEAGSDFGDGLQVSSWQSWKSKLQLPAAEILEHGRCYSNAHLGVAMAQDYLQPWRLERSQSCRQDASCSSSPLDMSAAPSESCAPRRSSEMHELW